MKNITNFNFKELNEKFSKVYCLVSGGIDSTYLYEMIKQEVDNSKLFPVNCYNPLETILDTKGVNKIIVEKKDNTGKINEYELSLKEEQSQYVPKHKEIYEKNLKTGDQFGSHIVRFLDFKEFDKWKLKEIDSNCGPGNKSKKARKK